MSKLYVVKFSLAMTTMTRRRMKKRPIQTQVKRVMRWKRMRLLNNMRTEC